MAKFTWTAKDASGNQVVRVISAANAEEGKAILLAEGCTDLALREDEIHHIAQEHFSKPMVFLGEEIKVTADQRIKQMDKPNRSAFGRIVDSVIQDKGLYGLLLLLIAFEFYRQQYIKAGGFALALLCWPVFRIWLNLPSHYYRQLNKAKDWHRWQEVMTLLEKTVKISKTHPVKIPATELARIRAQALVGLGHLEEGVAAMQLLENRPGNPSWLHKAHMASLYDIAKQHDTAIEYTRLGIAENPSPVLYADLANRLLRYKRDTVQAREALAIVDKATMSETAKPFVIRCHGILAYLEGDHPAAKKDLETAIEMVEKAHKRPFRDGALAVSRAYLCCTLARLGDTDGAKKMFALAKDYLVATDEKELIAECNRAIGEA
ncbi:MAG TPA: hypothetical protein VG754_06885 [Verrucomicrobiae bacterium]|jgi:tetratricopeptide (TPR) repeat protein|nr:hypothetical protein [Verrucomicrobiae bacterium]